MGTNWFAYDLELSSSAGVLTEIIADASSLTYTRSINAVGSATLQIPYSERRWNLCKPDSILDIWRWDGSGIRRRPMQTQWLLRKRTKQLDSSGERTITLECVDLMDLLNRRLIAYPDGDSHTTRSGTCEAVVKAIVTDNLITSAGNHPSGQSWSNWVSVEASYARGASVSDSSPWGNVLSTIQDLCQGSYQANGTFIAFDFEIVATLAYQFRIYTGQRGVDRSLYGQKPTIISVDGENFSDATYEEDYSSAYSAVIETGQGTGQLQTVRTVTDPNLISLGPFACFEAQDSSANSSNTTLLTCQGQTYLRANRPQAPFNGTLKQNASFVYGRDFEFGDLVTVQFGKSSFSTARVDTLSVAVDDKGAETISVTVTGELFA